MLQAHRFNTWGLVHTVWAFARAGCLQTADTLLLVPLVKAALKKLAKFNVMDIANTAWAFAKLTMSDPFSRELFAALVRASEQRICEFNT